MRITFLHKSKKKINKKLTNFAKLIYTQQLNNNQNQKNKTQNQTLTKINKKLTNQNIYEPRISCRFVGEKFFKENEIEITSATRGGL